VQRHLPDGVEGPFYAPGDQGYERTIAERLAGWRQAAHPKARS
jgi:hypothetical protein